MRSTDRVHDRVHDRAWMLYLRWRRSHYLGHTRLVCQFGDFLNGPKHQYGRCSKRLCILCPDPHPGCIQAAMADTDQ
jgi:hypothetical protein